MRFQHLLEAVYFRPWLITPAGWQTVHQLIQSKLARAERLEPLAARPIASFFGDPIAQMVVEDGVAIIPVKGVLGKGLSNVEKSCGACGTEDVASDLADAMASPRVTSVILDFDTPGGSVAGIPELAATIAQANTTKRVVAFTDGQLCSAGYFLSAGCYAVYATKTSDVGCIGTFVPFLDQSQAYAQAGMKVDIIRAEDAPLKGEGFPGTSLSNDFRAHLQEQINTINGWFTGHLAAHRGKMAADAMLGQSFLAEVAAEKGLIDGIVSSIEEVKNTLPKPLR